MNAVGAAIATVFAQAVSVVFAVVLLIKKNLPFKIMKKDFCLNPQCKKFLIIGLPLALQEFLTQMSFLALCAFVNRLGLEASSGYGVACKIVNFAMLVPSALMQSMASFVSQNVGAGNQSVQRNLCSPESKSAWLSDVSSSLLYFLREMSCPDSSLRMPTLFRMALLT